MSAKSLHLRELLHSLDHVLYILFTISYLLSPSHILSFALRLICQLQFANPRQIHPTKQLRALLAVWLILNTINTAIHAMDGSVGTKGDGWSGKGIMLDFIGQINTPSTFHLILLDFLIGFLQFILIIVAFAQPGGSAPATDAISTVNERRYAALLGELDFNEEEEVEDRSKFKPSHSDSHSEDSMLKPVVTIRFRAVWAEVVHPNRFEEESMV